VPGDVPSAEALALLDNASCGLLQTSDGGLIRRANQLFCSWIGVPREELVCKRRFQDLLTMGGRIFHQTHWVPLLRMQGTISEVKLEVLHADGSTIPMVLNAIRRDQDGEVAHEISAYVARDRDKYEKELVLARKRLEQLVAEANQVQEDAKDRAAFAEQMVGIVSHDLRNPLSSILLGASMLERSELSVAQRNGIARITRAGERANRLIADLLDFTQARLGKGLAISPAQIDLHDTVAEGVDELALLYPSRVLNHVRLGAGQCLADPSRIAQLLGNLVTNAMTYGAPKSAITVSTILDPAFFSLAVHNLGEPIPHDALPGLFDAMTRGTTAGSANRSVGLGLFIVRHIARAHGGEVSVRSTRDAGTTFTVKVPRKQL